MAHIYHGSNELILTAANKRSFDSGLNRVDCVFKCRTTTADDFSILLTAGAIMPGFDDYIIKDPATKEIGSDGFTTFTVSGFYGTLALSSGTSAVPSVIGAQSNDFSMTIKSVDQTGGFVAGILNFSLDFKILSDTLTRTFTIPTNDSITTLALPVVNLSFQIKYAAFSSSNGIPIPYVYDPAKSLEENIYAFVQLNKSGSYLIEDFRNYELLVGDTTISNVSRNNFGNVDEARVTWSQFFRFPSTFTFSYQSE